MLSSVENSSKPPDFQDVLLSFFFFFGPNQDGFDSEKECF